MELNGTDRSHQQVIRGGDWGLKSGVRLVWLALISYANSSDGTSAHPGNERLSHDLPPRRPLTDQHHLVCRQGLGL
jgi:hypothetical protein